MVRLSVATKTTLFLRRRNALAPAPKWAHAGRARAHALVSASPMRCGGSMLA